MITLGTLLAIAFAWICGYLTGNEKIQKKVCNRIIKRITRK